MASVSRCGWGELFGVCGWVAACVWACAFASAAARHIWEAKLHKMPVLMQWPKIEISNCRTIKKL